MKKITISVEDESYNLLEKTIDLKFIEEKIHQGKCKILEVKDYNIDKKDDENDFNINEIYDNNNQEYKNDYNNQLSKEKIIIQLNDVKIEKLVTKKDSLNALRKNISNDFKSFFKFKKKDNSFCTEEEEKNFKIEDIIIKKNSEKYIYLSEEINVNKEKTIPKRIKKFFIFNGKVVKEVDKNKYLSELREELQLENNDFFLYNSEGITISKEKTLKLYELENNDNINVIIIKKKFNFNFKTEEKNIYNGMFFMDDKLSKVRKFCKIKDIYLFTNKNGETINKGKEDSLTLNDLFMNNTILLKSKETIDNYKNDSKIKGKYLKTIDNLKIFLYQKEEKFNENELKNCKTIIMVGETGSGKTTMLNSLINYLMGVKLQDKYRYFLVDEPERIDKSHSQTSDVNIYYIRAKNGYYPNLRIIDTPGYGDTRGVEYDKKITNMIKEKFEKEIKTINSICFVAKSDKIRFTYEQNYVFNEVFSLFGKDIADNFIFLFTFCDNKEPAIINSLKINEPFKSFIPKIKQPWYLKFNNSGFFENPNDYFAKSFFKIGVESFNQFFDKIVTLPNKKVNVAQILSFKNGININIQNLEVEVNNLLKKINEINILIEIIEKNSKRIEELINEQYRNSYGFKNSSNNKNFLIILPDEINDFYCKVCDQFCLKNHHINYKFICPKINCNNHFHDTYHIKYNQRYIDESKVKNTVNIINNFYYSNFNTFPTIKVLINDLKLELEKIQIEALEKYEDLDFIKNKNNISKPYDFYESLKKKIFDERKKSDELGNIFSFSLNTIKEQIDSLKKEFTNKKYISYNSNFEQFKKDALKIKKKEIENSLLINSSEIILQNCNIY